MLNNDCKTCRNLASHWCANCCIAEPGPEQPKLFQNVPPWEMPELHWQIHETENGVMAYAKTGPVEIGVYTKPQENTENIKANMRFTYGDELPFLQMTSQTSFWLCLKEAEITAAQTITRHNEKEN